MKSWNQYTDKDRKEFTEAEYGSFNTGDAYTTGKGKNKQVAGYVRERVGFDKDGNPIANHGKSCWRTGLYRFSRRFKCS